MDENEITDYIKDRYGLECRRAVKINNGRALLLAMPSSVTAARRDEVALLIVYNTNRGHIRSRNTVMKQVRRTQDTGMHNIPLPSTRVGQVYSTIPPVIRRQYVSKRPPQEADGRMGLLR
ncbi:hypothetical protein EVAR_19883_1 [Eumeta japonica]|uniref:Uncharacterized protein n=1 Tax=Eumeta variegata TaxID=151549 RepID=A0A4C1XKW6_EUMVA|nr:hypothetical protein EVAR_19883_1 [Eumeta japonica]